MTNFTPEMIEKAKAAKTAEELLALAKENNVEMTEEEAKAYYAQINPVSGELADDELDNVAGGGCGDIDQDTFNDGDRVKVRDALNDKCIKCGSREGIYRCNATHWWVECSKPNCGYRIVEPTNREYHPAAFYDRI